MFQGNLPPPPPRSRVNVFGTPTPPRFIKLDLSLQGEQSMPPEQEQLLKSFMLQSVHLDVSLNEFASHGALTFVFKNPVATPVEMKFAFPLLDGGAVITGITTEWDGQRISGHVRDSAEGKKEYSDAIAKGHTASLVEHAENDLFMWRVGGIPGGSIVTVVSHFVGPVTMTKKFGKKPQTEITLTLPAVVPPWYGRAQDGDASLAFDTAAQAPASLGGIALALPPFTATVRSRFVTQSLQAVTVTSPTHGAPDASTLRTSSDGIEVSFRDLFKPRAGTKAATNLQMRWVADGIVPNMACVGRQLAGAGQLASATAGTDTLISQDAAATAAMEEAAKALASGPHAKDAQSLLDKMKTQQRSVEQVCGVLYSEHDGRQPERVHVTVLVDCSGSMYPVRIVKARKAVRALLTSLDPTSTFSVYLFGSSCRSVLLTAPLESGPVFEANADNINAVAAAVEVAPDMGGTALYAGVEEVMRLRVPADRRHNVMILTDGEVGGGESTRVKLLLAQVCPSSALVGIIGIGNEVTRTTLRKVVEGGLGPQAIMFDEESDESIASIVLGSINALISSQLRQVNWPGGKMVGSQPHIQWNNSEVCVAWALYPEAPPEPAAHASEDEEWELVPADVQAAGDSAARPAPQIRWLGGASVSVAAASGSPLSPPPPLPTFLVTNEDAVRSMCVAAALARCRHSSCSRLEATKLALRYGFVCADADTVMVAISDRPTGTAPSASFGIGIPSQPVTNTQLPGPTHTPSYGHNNYFSYSAAYGPSNYPSNLNHNFIVQSFSMQNIPDTACFGPIGCGAASFSMSSSPPRPQDHRTYVSSRRGPQRAPKGIFGPPLHAASLGGSFSLGAAPALLDDSRLASRQDYLAKREVKNLRELRADLGDEDMLFSSANLTAKQLDDLQHKREVLALASAASLGAAPVPLCVPPPQDDAFGAAPLGGAGTKKSKVFETDPSLLDVLGALQSASWSLHHPVVAAFLNKHLPTADTLLTSDAHATVAVIVVLRAKFKDSKAGWHSHVKRAAQSARRTLGDSAYVSLKESLARAISV
jgi:hypothetical protein